MKSELKEGERLDDLQLMGYEIIQQQKGFCFGVDAVFLSDFVTVKEGEQVLDLGTGTGILPILLSAKTKGEHFTGLELQKDSVDMALRSVAHNGLKQRIRIVEGDLCEAGALFGKEVFDVVVTNPPYIAKACGQTGKAGRDIARHEVCMTIGELLRETRIVLKERGRFYMVHRPFRLVELLGEMRKAQIEPKRMRFVHSYIDRVPKLVLLEGVKGAKAELRVEAPLVLYDTPEAYKTAP